MATLSRMSQFLEETKELAMKYECNCNALSLNFAAQHFRINGLNLSFMLFLG